jgi:hypothetical protein
MEITHPVSPRMPQNDVAVLRLWQISRNGKFSDVTPSNMHVEYPTNRCFHYFLRPAAVRLKARASHCVKFRFTKNRTVMVDSCYKNAVAAE